MSIINSRIYADVELPLDYDEDEREKDIADNCHTV